MQSTDPEEQCKTQPRGGVLNTVPRRHSTGVAVQNTVPEEQCRAWLKMENEEHSPRRAEMKQCHTEAVQSTAPERQ